jgi:acyl-CoA dehydrogenase
MVDFTLSQEDKELIRNIRFLGEKFMRPLGIEYDLKGEPVPPDHPFFKMLAQVGFQERVAGIGREIEGDELEQRERKRKKRENFCKAGSYNGRRNILLG